MFYLCYRDITKVLKTKAKAQLRNRAFFKRDCMKNPKEIVKKMAALNKYFKNLPKIIGNEYVNFALDNFKKQAWEGKAWPKRANQDERDGRSLLVKTGALRRSIKYQLARRGGGTVITVNSNMKYAKAHNEGLNISATVKVKPHDRRTKKGIVKVKAHNRVVNFDMPERRFMGQSKAFEQHIITIIQNQINKIIK